MIRSRSAYTRAFSRASKYVPLIVVSRFQARLAACATRSCMKADSELHTDAGDFRRENHRKSPTAQIAIEDGRAPDNPHGLSETPSMSAPDRGQGSPCRGPMPHLSRPDAGTNHPAGPQFSAYKRSAGPPCRSICDRRKARPLLCQASNVEAASGQITSGRGWAGASTAFAELLLEIPVGLWGQAAITGFLGRLAHHPRLCVLPFSTFPTSSRALHGSKSWAGRWLGIGAPHRHLAAFVRASAKSSCVRADRVVAGKARTKRRLVRARSTPQTRAYGCRSGWKMRMKSIDVAFWKALRSPGLPPTCRGMSANYTSVIRTVMFFELVRGLANEFEDSQNKRPWE